MYAHQRHPCRGLLTLHQRMSTAGDYNNSAAILITDLNISSTPLRTLVLDNVCSDRFGRSTCTEAEPRAGRVPLKNATQACCRPGRVASYPIRHLANAPGGWMLGGGGGGNSAGSRLAGTEYPLTISGPPIGGRVKARQAPQNPAKHHEARPTKGWPGSSNCPSCALQAPDGASTQPLFSRCCA